MLQGLGDLLVVNVPVDHVELHGIPLQSCNSFQISIADTALLVSIYGVLRASTRGVLLDLAPVEMHLNKLVIDIKRATAKQSGRVVGHGEQLQSVT